jgi:hypothetical protein
MARTEEIFNRWTTGQDSACQSGGVLRTVIVFNYVTRIIAALPQSGQ